MPKLTPYYSLLEQADRGEPWVIAFGDYDRPTVEQEERDLKEHAMKTVHFFILRTADDSQAAIDAGIANLNAAIASFT